MTKRTVGISVTALGIAALGAAVGCTRTSDGSYVLRRPAMLSHVSREPESAAAVQPLGPPAYAVVSPPPASSPPQSKMPKVTVPAISITDPPFKRSDPDKPLSCKNETSPTGRIRFVCT